MGARALDDHFGKLVARMAVRRPREHAEQLQERRIRAADAAVLVDARNRDRRIVEEAGEPDFRRTQGLRGILARRPVEDQRAAVAERTRGRDWHTMQKPHGKALTVALLHVEIDDARLDLARRTTVIGEKRNALPLDDIGELQSTRLETRQILPEPIGERCVQIGDCALGIGREEAGRRMVEEGDDLLQLLEACFLLVALAGDIRNEPGGKRRGLHPLSVREHDRTHTDAIPAHATILRAERMDRADLLSRLTGLARGLRQAEDAFSGLGVAREQSLDRLEVVCLFGPSQDRIGLVGKDDPAIGIRDDEAVGQRFEHKPAEACAALGTLTEPDEADRAGEQRTNADDRQNAEEDLDVKRRLLSRQHGQQHCGHDKRRRQQDQPYDAARFFRPVDDGIGNDRSRTGFLHAAPQAPILEPYHNGIFNRCIRALRGCFSTESAHEHVRIGRDSPETGIGLRDGLPDRRITSVGSTSGCGQTSGCQRSRARSDACHRAKAASWHCRPSPIPDRGSCRRYSRYPAAAYR